MILFYISKWIPYNEELLHLVLYNSRQHSRRQSLDLRIQWQPTYIFKQNMQLMQSKISSKKHFAKSWNTISQIKTTDLHRHLRIKVSVKSEAYTTSLAMPIYFRWFWVYFILRLKQVSYTKIRLLNNFLCLNKWKNS